MKLSDRLNTLIQATTLAQKSGALTLDVAVQAKTAIDIITSGVLNQNFTSAINFLIEIAVMTQKKGLFSLKDAHMIYLAIDGIEGELQNKINKENMGTEENEIQSNDDHNNESIITIPPKKLKRKSE
jgi:ribosome-associated translation inhibitor RaiA